MRKLEVQDIIIKGFKSIKSLPAFSPRPINVFIGQNGAGKSNFINFFKFLSNMLSGTGNLAGYTGLHGGASSFLFDGAEITPQMTGSVKLKTKTGLNEYKFRLSHAAADTFVYTEEQFRYTPKEFIGEGAWKNLGTGHKESFLINADTPGNTQVIIKKMLQQLVTYQFHNTTFNSPIRNNKADLENNDYYFLINSWLMIA